MPKYIIERDEWLVKTSLYGVEADNMEEAIEKTKELEPVRERIYPENEYSYEDSREVTEEEWARVLLGGSCPKEIKQPRF